MINCKPFNVLVTLSNKREIRRLRMFCSVPSLVTLLFHPFSNDTFLSLSFNKFWLLFLPLGSVVHHQPLVFPTFLQYHETLAIVQQVPVTFLTFGQCSSSPSSVLSGPGDRRSRAGERSQSRHQSEYLNLSSLV